MFQLKPHSSPWFTPCAASIAHRNHYFHQYYRDVTFLYSRYHCKKILKDARSNYAEATLCYVASQLIGSHDFWRICNSLLTSTNKTNLFARNFSCNSTLGFQQITDFPLVVNRNYDLAASKSTGPDGIPAIVLKRCVLQSFLLFLLSYIINACPNLVFLPVVPVFKNNRERSDPGKYHPISLLLIISKIFASFFNDCLTNHLDITGLFSDLQYDFRAFRSTADILTVLSEHIYNSLDAGRETRAIALDISKAFDKVWHAGLLH